MPSIRKTKSSTQSLRKAKKRLKKQIAELNKDFERCNARSLKGFLQADAIHEHIYKLMQELQQLKRKKV